jgi:hypothetical protein
MCPCLGVTLFHPGCRILHADVMKNLKRKKIYISPFQISFPHPLQKTSFLPVKLHSDIPHRTPFQITCTAASSVSYYLPVLYTYIFTLAGFAPDSLYCNLIEKPVSPLEELISSISSTYSLHLKLLQPHQTSTYSLHSRLPALQPYQRTNAHTSLYTLIFCACRLRSRLPVLQPHKKYVSFQ